MIKISIYVNAGFDESEELVGRFCNLLADRGFGMVEMPDGSFSEDDMNAIITLSNLPEDESDKEGFVESIVEGQRIVAFPKITENEKMSSKKLNVPDSIPDEEILDNDIDPEFVMAEVWNCIEELEDQCMERNAGEVLEDCLTLDNPCLEHKTAITLETLFWLYTESLEKIEEIEKY